MKQRIITGLLGGAAILAILLAPATILGIAVALVSLFALYELYTAIGLTKKAPLLVIGFLFAIFAVFGEKISRNLIMPLIFFYIVMLFVIMMIYHQQISFHDIAVSFFLSAYVLYTMAHIVFVRNLPFGNYSVFLIFVGAFATDSCAYFSGTFLGKHKLCPHISPKKTVEGAIGGVLGAVLFFVLLAVVIDFAFPVQVNYWALLVLGILSGIISEVGDIAASLIKRQYHIKDFGNVLPGHGGIMDRLDSIIFIAPLVFYFVQYIPIFY